MGKKRLQAVRESLAGRFRGQPPATVEQGGAGHEVDRSVPVEELLDIDRQYRRLAKQGRLPRVAPRQFNPTREAWLPILHTEREERHYTAMYSNTAHAHQAGATHDWVIIYRDDHQHGGPWTVITASYGPCKGQRVVRGRELECQATAIEHSPTALGPDERKHQKTLGFGDG
jgi:putative hydrolase